MINFNSVVTTSAFSLLSLAAAPMASAITITSNGTWTGVSGNPTSGPTGIGTSEVRWGAAAPGQPTNSGYLFDGVSSVVDDSELLSGATFKLGTFTHENYTIFLPSITSASLDLSIDFGGAGSQTFSYVFDHNETPNNQPGRICSVPSGFPEPCPDIVSIPDAQSSQEITLNGATYNLEVLGFMTEENSPIVSEFITFEEQDNEAMLFGRLTLVPGSPDPDPGPIEPVPEPLTILGASAALGFGGFFKRKVSQQKNKKKA